MKKSTTLRIGVIFILSFALISVAYGHGMQGMRDYEDDDETTDWDGMEDCHNGVTDWDEMDEYHDEMMDEEHWDEMDEHHTDGVDDAQSGGDPDGHETDNNQRMGEPGDPQRPGRTQPGGQTVQSVAPIDVNILTGIDYVEPGDPAGYGAHQRPGGQSE